MRLSKTALTQMVYAMLFIFATYTSIVFGLAMDNAVFYLVGIGCGVIAGGSAYLFAYELFKGHPPAISQNIQKYTERFAKNMEKENED